MIYSLTIVVVLIGGSFLLKGKSSTQNTNTENSINNKVGDNIEMIDGKQIISIDVKGGYWPRKTVAKAGVPTVIKFNTNNTFDCSLSLRLPSKGINKIVPQTGSSEVDIGTSTPGQFFGTCGMGMYSFEIEFKS